MACGPSNGASPHWRRGRLTTGPGQPEPVGLRAADPAPRAATTRLPRNLGRCRGVSRRGRPRRWPQRRVLPSLRPAAADCSGAAQKVSFVLHRTEMAGRGQGPARPIKKKGRASPEGAPALQRKVSGLLIRTRNATALNKHAAAEVSARRNTARVTPLRRSVDTASGPSRCADLRPSGSMPLFGARAGFTGAVRAGHIPPENFRTSRCGKGSKRGGGPGGPSAALPNHPTPAVWPL